MLSCSWDLKVSVISSQVSYTRRARWSVRLNTEMEQGCDGPTESKSRALLSRTGYLPCSGRGRANTHQEEWLERMHVEKVAGGKSVRKDGCSLLLKEWI